jgi:hypothetical protein
VSRDKDSPKDNDNEIAEISSSERARAEGFARLVDGLLAGEPIPPAMDSEDRALLEAATMVVASTQEVRLSAERTRTLVDDALEQALTGENRRNTSPPLGDDEGDKPRRAREDTDVIRINRRRADRFVRALPWVVATVAAAAAILLFFTRPENLGDTTGQEVAQQGAYSLSHRSRPADTLVGQIPREASGDASTRLDMIYTDRLAGYRDLTLRQPAGRRGPVR